MNDLKERIAQYLHADLRPAAFYTIYMNCPGAYSDVVDALQVLLLEGKVETVQIDQVKHYRSARSA